MPIMRKEQAGLLFIHIPKTGGSSVEWAFRDAGWDVNFVDGNRRKGSVNYYRRCTPQHVEASVLEATYRLDRFDGIFAYVRDPLKRVLSEYVFRSTASKGSSVDTSAAAFEEWVRASLATTYADPYHLDNHMRPQHEFLVPGTRVYRFEDGLDAGLEDLKILTGLDVPPSAPRRNTGEERSGGTPRDVEVNDNVRRLVGSFYAEDYRRFGYARPDETDTTTARAPFTRRGRSTMK
ncbi:sulfotransferase family 2 domain-containing protein [uncultured Demequina sp.]|uniref:sulfotransferase family 2 domain-containing protein n=1 Tax=uncultured Demequina sp. TaxID=693499 RepID=UPI0025E60EF3|nr:sulfotransferase family 2 domain-containing protein [uncultured Demequina sp.]